MASTGSPGALPPVGGRLTDVVTVTDPRLAHLLDPGEPLVRLGGGYVWAEGPVWLPDRAALLFSDIPNDRAVLWTEAEGATIVRSPSDFTNGHTLDAAGRVLHCEHGPRRVTRSDGLGPRTVVVDRHAGRRLNSPNDVVVRSDGTIWFTDPPYGILSDREGYAAPSEQEGCFVYRVDPATGAIDAVIRDMQHPNGLAFSPDETTLYVADSYAAVAPGASRHIRAYPIAPDGSAGPGRVFATIDPGIPDGFRVDVDGNVWTSAGDGIHVIAPDGIELGRIRTPEPAANCTFGGADGRRLFITASSSLWAIATRTTGAGVAAAAARREGSR